MKLLGKANALFDSTIGLSAFLAAILLVFIMLSVVYEIGIRYFLGRSIQWTLEVIEYCLLYITFLGAAWLLKMEGHVKIDLLLIRLNRRAQALLNTITSITGAIICLIVTWLGIWVTWECFQIGYEITSELEPPQFLILLIIPLGSFLLFIQFLRRTYGYLSSWKVSPDKEQRL